MKNKGITLIALIITIIIMLILAGIVLTMALGENGLLSKTKYAATRWNNSVEDEQKELDKLYSSILVAENSKITLTMEELDKYIDKKINKPTGVKADTYIINSISRTTIYTDLTSMSGLTISKDENNKIDEYLSYSNQDGYTVQKSGWYFIKLHTMTYASSGFSSTYLYFHLNGVALAQALCTASGGLAQTYDDNTFSVFLSQGDKIYFSSNAGSSAAKGRSASAVCYPMF